jgi:hypothetical protein
MKEHNIVVLEIEDNDIREHYLAKNKFTKIKMGMLKPHVFARALEVPIVLYKRNERVITLKNTTVNPNGTTKFKGNDDITVQS